MSDLEVYRKLCLDRQTELRRVMARPEHHDEAIELFLAQHAMLHSIRMAGTAPWSFEDAVFDGVSEDNLRKIPPKGEHSIVWNIWHLARIEDVTMNILVAGGDQILHR